MKKPKKQHKKPTNKGKVGKDSSRNEKGQFVPGHKKTNGSGESPYARKARQLREALIAAISEKDIQEIIETQLKKAKAGNTEAVNLVLNRALGKPIQSHELYGKDGGAPIPVKIVHFDDVAE